VTWKSWSAGSLWPQHAGNASCRTQSKLHVTHSKGLPTALDDWWHSAPSDPCLDKVYTSSCRLEDVLAGNLEIPSELERVSRLRSWRKELVFTAVDARGVLLAINWVLSLRAQGIDHSLVITDSPTLCKALFYSDARVSCGWTSFLSQCVPFYFSACILCA
jgi:hypothetical protein